MWQSSGNTNRAIAHVDCDAFFTSVEQALHPELKGKPVVTGKERGIAASMSYEAKERGVVRGMVIWEVKKACPDCVILPSDYETYSLISKRLFDIIRRFTPEVEEYSIDEAYADLTGLRRLYRCSYEEIALKIKHDIEEELGITVSVGLASTKSLAKICSKQKKPAGFTCVKNYELNQFLKNIPTERVCGFGPNTVALLKKNGVETVLNYILRPESFAKKLLGKIGVELWHELRGEAAYCLATQPKEDYTSISKVKTFTPPSNDKEFVRAQLLRNLESAFIKLRRHGLRAKRLGILLRDSEYHSLSLEADLTYSTSATLEAVPLASSLFEKIFDPRLKYRQSGIWLTHIEEDREIQYELFEDSSKRKALNELSQCIDRINELYGKHTLHIGSTHCLEKYRQHLGERGDVASRKINLLTSETFRQHLGIPIWKVTAT